METRRFIADVMLGHLAGWLRMLGFDTLYNSGLSDGEILRKALSEDRVILTRDTHFLKIKNAPRVFFVHSEDPSEQVSEFAKTFGLEGCGIRFCSICNMEIELLKDREAADALVPEYILMNAGRIFRCRVCGKVYWEGSHVKNFRSMIERLNFVRQ